MATKIEEGKKVVREIAVAGIESPVIVSMDKFGLELKIPGSRISIAASWFEVSEACKTPSNVPSFLMDKPYEFLDYQAHRRNKRINQD